MKNKILVLGTVMVAFTLTGCASDTSLKDGEEVVASVEGKKFSAEDLYEEMIETVGDTVLINMIDEFILNKEFKTDEDAETYAESNYESMKASYESYGQDFEEVLKNAGFENANAYKETLILEYKKTLAAENYVKDQITEDEIESYYNNKIYGDIEAKHILIAPENDEDMTDEEIEEAEEKAKAEAEKLIKELKDGADFEELAKKYSDDEGTASNGGALTVTYGDVVDEFWDATYELKDGKYTTEPVKSEYGYHIIYRESSKDKPKLSKVKEDIIDKIVEEKLAEDTTLQDKAMVALRKEYDLDIKDKDINKAYNQTVESIEKSSSN